MSSADNSNVDQRFLSNAMASAIQIGAVLLLLMTCFKILSPFLGILVWALLISVAIFPFHVSLTERLGDRQKWSATVIVLIGLAIIIVPTWLLAESTISGMQFIANDLQDGQVAIPPPNDRVADWPLIGDRVHEVWSSAAVNLEETLNRFEPQIQALSQKATAVAAHTVGTVFQFIFSMIVAGILLTVAADGRRVTDNLAVSLVGNERGRAFTSMSILTVQSVFKGVLGVAAIQAVACGIGLVVMGVPAAGIWTGLVLILAIVQIPVLIVMGPIAFWVFSIADPVPATIFLVYAVVASASDVVLKPMMLGRGVDTPMLVILLGAIGGAFTMGILGLFVGAVVLALGYEILTSWMAPDEQNAEIAAES